MKKIHWYDYLTINVYWLGLTTVSQSNGLIIPLLVQQFVGVERQGAAFGRLRLYTLMIALLVQAAAGALSDRSALPWGRRRPFILIGTLLNVGCLLAIVAAPNYAFLFAAAICSQIASNIAHGAQQGLIPDLTPENRRGRFSGVKSVMDLLPVIIVALTIGQWVKDGELWLSMIVVCAILLASMGITMLVRESPLRSAPGRMDWRPYVRLLAMTAVFLVIILGAGWLVTAVGGLFSGVESLTAHILAMGGVGFLAMVAATILGVWLSVRIGVGGEGMRQTPSYVWWVINRLAFLIGVTNISSFAVYFLQGKLHLEGKAAAGPASQLMMVTGILILLCALPSGWLADRFGRKRLLILSGLLGALGVVILIAGPGMATLYVGGAVIGAATGIFFTTNWALGTALAPPDKAGQYLGISNLAGAGAGAVGSYIGGPIADYFTRRAPQSPGVGYIVIFAIYAALFLVSVLVLARIEEIRETPA